MGPEVQGRAGVSYFVAPPPLPKRHPLRDGSTTLYGPEVVGTMNPCDPAMAGAGIEPASSAL